MSADRFVLLPEAEDPQRFGRKAANLAASLRAGVHVPAGFVLSPTGAQSTETISAAAATIVAWAREHAEWGLVVRSSATVEDGIEASYAGLLESMFTPARRACLINAIERVAASGSHERVRLYEQARGRAAAAAGVAVLVQAAVRPRASGVVFAPWTAQPGSYRIESTLGLSLLQLHGEVRPDVLEGVAERVTVDEVAEKFVVVLPAQQAELALLPGEWVELDARGEPRAKLAHVDIDDGLIYLRPPTELARRPALPRPVATELVAMCQRVARVLNLDRLDIEWAYDIDGRLWLVQARPATAPARHESPPHPFAGVLQGHPAAPGIAIGETRVLRDVSEARTFERGRVLVTGPARPELMPAIMASRGIVSADAGALCHTAIVARELGKPCVVGLHDALDVLPTGTTVRVDGTSGTVTPTSEATSCPPAGTTPIADDLPLVDVLAGLAALDPDNAPPPDGARRVLAIDTDLAAALQNDPALIERCRLQFAGFLLPPGVASPNGLGGHPEPFGGYGEVHWITAAPTPPYAIAVRTADGEQLLHSPVA